MGRPVGDHRHAAHEGVPHMPAPLRLAGVRIDLGGRTLVPGLDLEVGAGECVTVMGPSGCGKSTLLAMIAGSLDPAFRAEGRVLVGGIDVTDLPPERRRIGIQFQDDLLFPHLSVAGNLAFALPRDVRDRAERRRRVVRALAEAELPGFEDRDPATLSGGQRARVALMRTLLSRPLALLLDEPFNRLDAQLRGEFRRFVFEHVSERRLPMLLVTHDPADAPTGARVITLGD
jgi:putative thiamine transport system ATP-binding protein